MRFLALLKKELRECLPWMVLAAVILLTSGTIEFLSKRAPGAEYFRYNAFAPIGEIRIYNLTTYPTVALGPIMTLLAIALGITVAIRQYWMPHYLREWNYVLHRPISRQRLLLIKLLAGFVAITLPLGLVWSYLFWQGTRQGFLPVPLPARHFIDGWLMIIQGFILYLGTAVAGMSRAKWYTTKLIPLLFALWAVTATFGQWQLTPVVSTTAVVAVILLYQVFDAFLKREF